VNELATKVWGRVKGCASAVGRYGRLAAVAFGTLAASAHASGSTVTLPDTGANISGLVTAGITAIGAIVAVIVGGYFSFLVIRLAMKWARRIA
jgi:hypothetical protein